MGFYGFSVLNKVLLNGLLRPKQGQELQEHLQDHQDHLHDLQEHLQDHF